MGASPTYPERFPAHIAIIMDGNGRWAQARHRPRVFGHQAGVKTVRRVVEDASEMGVKCLTLYSFSTENWSRPKSEIAALFSLLREYVEQDLEKLHERGVKIRVLGSKEGLKPDLISLINRVQTTTAENRKFQLNIAFNYGGRDEFLRATKRAIADGHTEESLTSDVLESYLDTAGLPDPDLVIRTSGEMRISNFLLWQAAYAEFVFTDVLWPDFTRADLEAAISDYQHRDRRFGNLSASEVA